MLTCWQVLLNRVCAIAQWLLRNIGWMTRNRLCSAGDQIECNSDEMPFNGFSSWAEGIWASGVIEPDSFDLVSLDKDIYKKSMMKLFYFLFKNGTSTTVPVCQHCWVFVREWYWKNCLNSRWSCLIQIHYYFPLNYLEHEFLNLKIAFQRRLPYLRMKETE